MRDPGFLMVVAVRVVVSIAALFAMIVAIEMDLVALMTRVSAVIKI